MKIKDLRPQVILALLILGGIAAVLIVVGKDSLTSNPDIITHSLATIIGAIAGAIGTLISLDKGE